MKSKKRMRQRREVKLKTTLRRASWVASAFVAVIAIGLTIFFNVTNKQEGRAAVSGEYRSKTSGNWSSSSTWQKYNGSSWSNATSAPSSSDQTVTILSGHTVTITGSATIDQVVVNNGGKLILNSGVNVTLNNGSGTDLDVSGTMVNAGKINPNASATVVFQSTGYYQHNFTTSNGDIPVATWNTGSTCEITSYLTSSNGPNNLGQSFYNFIWNCPLQTKVMQLSGALRTVNGDLTITSTGLLGGIIFDHNANSTLNVGGDFTLTAGYVSMADQGSSTNTLNISGNYTQSGGTLEFMTGNSASGNINIAGDFTQTAGTLSSPTNTTKTLVSFTGSGNQTFSTTLPIVIGNVDYQVNSGSTLLMGNSIMYGRNFTVASGGGISLGSSAAISAAGLFGNIQVTGTKTFNSNSDYVFNGSSSQTFGTGMPTTVRNLTVNNGANMTLPADLIVTGTLTLTNGKITTGAKTLYLTNTSTSSLTGFSSSNYIIGNLNRSVSSTGTYNFPLGTSSQYQLATLALSGTSGFANISGSFVSGDPNNATYDLDSVSASGVQMSELLTGGYWSFASNSPLTAGSFTATLNEQGYSNAVLDGTVMTLVSRSSLTSEWLPTGVHDDATQTVTGTTATAVRSALKTFGVFAIALGDYAAFSNPTLRSGTAGQVNAVYVFPQVMRGVDAWVQIMDLNNGATLNNIDDASLGYNTSFQPFINYPPNKTSYVEWKIMFKKGGTATDTTLKKITATGIDVDGNSNIREFIEATMPYSYNLDPSTILTITNNAGRYRALGPTSDFGGIDSSVNSVMYELNYVNVNTLGYRTGAVNVSGSTYTRQTSLFFKSFNLGVKNIALPIKLISFDAKLRNGTVNLSWATAAEINNDYFTIERSSDGQNFESVLRQRGAGNSTNTLNYDANDPNPLEGYSYYRLKQTDYDGHFTYSDVQTVKNKGGKSIDEDALSVTSIAPNPFSDQFRIDFIVKQKLEVHISMVSSTGELIFQEMVQAQDGYNSYDYNDSKGLPPGYYFITVSYNDQKVTKKVLKL